MKNKNWLRSSFFMKAAVFVLVLFSAINFASAQTTTTFAQFFEVNGTNDFVFTNNFGLSGSFSTIPGGSPIVFTYQNVSGLPLELQGPQAAHIFVTASTTTPGFTNGDRVVQPFDRTFRIEIIRDTPASVGAGSRTNLLTAVITPAGTSFSDITGDNSASSAAYTASTPNQTVAYGSDFVTFSSTVVARNLALSFSSVTPPISLSTGGFLSSFSAAGTGTFAANPGPTFMIITAASKSISGRVFAGKGRAGLANARVSLTNSAGETFTTLTNSSGYYRFNDVEVGQTVVVSVSSKRFTYMPKAMNVGDELVGIDFFPE